MIEIDNLQLGVRARASIRVLTLPERVVLVVHAARRETMAPVIAVEHAFLRSPRLQASTFEVDFLDPVRFLVLEAVGWVLRGHAIEPERAGGGVRVGFGPVKARGLMTLGIGPRVW